MGGQEKVRAVQHHPESRRRNADCGVFLPRRDAPALADCAGFFGGSWAQWRPECDNTVRSQREKPMTGNHRIATTFAVGVLFAVLAGCQKEEGPAERAGKALDNAVQEAGKKVEQAGEKIQDAAKEAQK